MAKFRKKLISATEPLATAAGIRSPVEQLQDLNALSISVVTVCADTSGTDGGLADDTAINTAGGFVKITGTGFRNTSPTTIVYINGVTATYNYLSSTSIVVTVPAATAGTTASLIVFNGSTVGSIWAAGISYSGFPSWTTTAASNLGLVVSTQLVAVGDAPLVYTFVSGTLPPNCTISSSGLLSGTVTGVSTNVIYTFTVAVTDAQNQNVSQSIVYTLVVSDFYYRYNSLHISGDSNPTWITDASTNALAVAPAGAPQATIFSPVKEGYYGNSFSGGEYLTIPDSASFTFGANDFTIECWVYSSFAANYGIMSNCDSGTSTSSMTFYFAAFGTQVMAMAAYGSTLIQAAAPALTPNAWNHVAFVRDGTVTRAYTNGVQGATTGAIGTNALNDSVNVMTIGRFGNYASMYFNGYISNLRIVKGTCVYPNGTTFTPSATPLTAITNTVLLTCQSNRFIDNSAAPATITVAGTPKVVSSNPFNLPSGLAAYGSGYFNGSSYLSIPSNATLAMGTGDFTIECWVNTPLVNANNDVLIELRSTGATSTGFVFNMNPTGVGYQLNFYTDGGFNLGSTVLNYNVWNHVAVTRSGTTVRLFSNGVVSATFTKANNFSDTPVPQIGSSPLYSPSSVIGYISNLRVVKGTAVYTAAFTPPTAPLTAVAGTSLLTLQTNVPHNNSQFRDTSTNNFLVTRVGNPTQGSFSPFTKQYPYSTTTVGGSVYFDSTAGDYLNIADPTSTFNFGSGNFTVEAWVYSKGGQSVMIWGNGSSGNNWVAFYTSTAAEFAIAVGGAVPLDVLTGTNSIVSDQWSHVALVRNGDVFTIYINGIKGNSGTRAGAVPYYDATNTYFGGPRWPGDTASSNGYMSNLRIVKGVAVYTANFTPSTAPLTAIPGTVLLMPFTNAAVYDNTMLNNFETVGAAGVSTAVTKYCSGSLKFNGTTDYLTIPANPKLAFGSGDFTIEAWVYANALGSYNGVLAQWPASNGDANNSYVLESVGSNMNFYWVSGVTLYGPATLGTITTGEWIHYAICRSGNTLYPFKNGVLGTTASITQTLNSPTSAITVGGAVAGSGYWNGHIDELRITKGYARYTAAFTPATGAFSVSAPFGASTLPSKSLRLRASASAYLNRTPAIVGNQKTWTWSGWVKRGTLGVYAALFAQGTGSVGNGYGFLRFDSNDTLSFTASADGNTPSAAWASTQVYRDPAAWYHVVAVLDTTQVYYGNRFKLYVNGVLQSGTFSASPGQNADIQVNRAALHQIGVTYANGFGNYFDGEMAEVNFVDGLALDPTMFGAYSTYGQWLPVSYSGYMGANGFYLPFTNTPSNTSTVTSNYLVVAGGGGAGGSNGSWSNGGGGGGGYISGSGLTLDPTQVYTVIVGAGGAAGAVSSGNASSGTNSVLSSFTAIGGGGGAGVTSATGSSGGSGGGGAPSAGLGGAGTAGQGFRGGNANSNRAGPGGGGASAAGTDPPNTSFSYPQGGHAGGAGSAANNISGTSTQYAGGGGTGGMTAQLYGGANGGAGGVGGGGAGGYADNSVGNPGAAGTANTGGGGGSGGLDGYSSTIGASGAGGSGVVIISYVGAQRFSGGTITSSGGNTIHKFTSSGALSNITSDTSGNGNNWTPNNINVSTLGPTYDLLTDVPTLTSATAANYAVLNPLDKGAGITLSNANLTYSTSGTAGTVRATIQIPPTGKYYWEATVIAGTPMDVGIATASAGASTYLGQDAYGWGYYTTDGIVYRSNATLATYSTATTGDVIGLAFNADAQTFALYKNNTIMGTLTGFTQSGTYFPAAGSITSGGSLNFGQQPFVYTPPSGFVALNTYNI